MMTGDPERDAEAYMNYLDDQLNRRPVCVNCHEHIQEEYAYELDGELYCDECAYDWLRKQKVDIENLIVWG